MWRVQVCGKFKCVVSSSVWRVQVCGEFKCVASSSVWRVQVYGDFKQTINPPPISHHDRDLTPKVEDVFTFSSGGKLFSKIDLSQAYQQVPFEEESRCYVVINTQKRLFWYTRLPVYPIAVWSQLSSRNLPKGVLQ